MSVYQQRIPLRGSESSVHYFTELLRGLKSADPAGSSSADILLRAAGLWKARTYSARVVCTARSRPGSLAAEDGGALEQQATFYLQLMTSTEIQQRINDELDVLRRDMVMRAAIDRDGSVHSSGYLLEAIIIVLELLKADGNSAKAKETATSQQPNAVGDILCNTVYVVESTVAVRGRSSSFPPSRIVIRPLIQLNDGNPRPRPRARARCTGSNNAAAFPARDHDDWEA